MKTTIDKIITVASGLSIKSNKINTDLSNIILTQSELIAVGGKLDNILSLFNNTIPDSSQDNGSSGSNTGSQSDLVALGILPKQISEFTNDDIGTIISIPYTDESGKMELNGNGCIEFEVVGVNHHQDINDAAKPTITLMTKNVIRSIAYDAIENGPGGQTLGNYKWSVSNIRQWLNSNNSGGTWYSAQHDFDAPPSEENVDMSRNQYANDPGFLAGFGSDIKQHFATIKNITALADSEDTDFEITDDKVFLASYTEMGYGKINEIAEGKHLSIKYPNKESRIKYLKEYEIVYWLRGGIVPTQVYGEQYIDNVYAVDEFGGLAETMPCGSEELDTGIAPLIVLY